MGGVFTVSIATQRVDCSEMSVRTYNPSVRVGNWNEDICLEEVSKVLSVCQNLPI